MKPKRQFLNLPKPFWANVRSIGQQVKYTERATGRIKVPSLSDMVAAMEAIGLRSDHIVEKSKPTDLGRTLSRYFEYRAEALNTFVQPRLMDVKRAKAVFQEHRRKLAPKCPLPTNKQTGDKKTRAYFTGIINMLIEAYARGFPCDYDPKKLTTLTLDGVPLRTLARRVDGAFTSSVNPVAVWEIKEYYYTTTFGSRVADGVYETLLDGMELEELRQNEGVDVGHYLMIDGRYTWWDCGRSYLCRIVDMLHMGYVDEVLFGYEVVERLPAIVRSWTKAHRRRPR